MQYLLSEMVLYLVSAGLIGAFLGWLYRGGGESKAKLESVEKEWETRYNHSKELWQNKVKMAEDRLDKGLQQSNHDWSLKLKDYESRCEARMKDMLNLYASNEGRMKVELAALKDELSATKRALKKAKKS